MARRTSLTAPTPDPSVVERLAHLAREIVDALDSEKDASAQLSEVREITGCDDYDEPFFRMLYGASSPEEFAEHAALGTPPVTPDISREEIIELISLATEPGRKQTFYLNMLEKNLPNAEISDLIFWPDRERTNDEIADEALFRVSLWREGGLPAVKKHLFDLAEQVRADKDAPAWAQTWADSYRLKP